MTDAAERTVGGQPPLAQELAPLGGVELLLCTVDPAALHTQRVRGVHQVAESERAVVLRGGNLIVYQHHDDCGRLVERVCAAAHDGCVHAGEAVARGAVGHHDEVDGLATHTAGGKSAGLDDLLERCPVDRSIGVVRAAAAAGK